MRLLMIGLVVFHTVAMAAAEPLTDEQRLMVESARQVITQRQLVRNDYLNKMAEIKRESDNRQLKTKSPQKNKALRSTAIKISKSNHGWRSTERYSSYQDYIIRYNILKPNHTEDILKFFADWIAKGWFIEKTESDHGHLKDNELPSTMKVRIIKL